MAGRSSIDAGSPVHPVLSSSLSGSYDVPAIFLSHSGRQKPFVERLNEALLKVNHVAFFDQHSLPKGSPFPERIMTAARKCTLGVVVLSDDFLTSKWPLLELEILVQQRGKGAKVLPLFYKLLPKDLKCREKLAKWKEKWEELAREPEDVAKWEKAVNVLRGINGEIFQQGTSESLYIKRAVQSICRQVPCSLPYDMSEIRGHRRLAQGVAGQFISVCHVRQDGGVCMVGLHGVGGLGKSTMCKALANFYWAEYLGKSHHLELPTDGTDTGIILQECKKALTALADLDENLLTRAVDIDQVIQLMKKHLAQHDMFLAIDNVWESSRETAGRILKVGFSSKSKILVTSRSEELLKDLFLDQENSHVGPLPAPKHEEAFQIFQEAFRLGDLNSLVMERHLVDGALARCNFDGTYNALALKALGLHVKNACALGGLQHLSRVLREMKSVELPKGVEGVIRRSYDSLEEYKRHMFLDIAVLRIMRGGSDILTVEKACQWLSLLYERQLPKGEVDTYLNATIYELCLGGLLQIKDGKTIIVHDLLSDLAKNEAARSSRFFIAGRSSGVVEEVQWQKLERVILHGFCDLQFIDQLQRQECRRLQVLDACKVGFSEGIDMRLMPALCVLKLHEVSLSSVLNWPASALAIIDLQNVVRFEQPLGSMPFVQLREVTSLEDVAGLRMLAMEEMEGLGTLRTLRSLRLENYDSLKRIPDLSALTRLVTLRLAWNGSMKEVGGLSVSLRVVEIEGCGALERVGDMSRGLRIFHRLSQKSIPDRISLARLDELCLWGNQLMVGGLSSSLGHVAIRECRALESVQDISALTCLENLEISDCQSLKRIPDLSGLAGLDLLRLWGNRSIEQVGSLSSSLKNIEIGDCQALERVLDMSGLTLLEKLQISNCQYLKEIPDLSGLAMLDQLLLLENQSMEEVGALSLSLRVVEICGCVALERVPDLNWLTCLEKLQISFCDSLKRVPDLSSLARLYWLILGGNRSMEQVGGLSSSLRDVEIWACEALERVPDMAGLTRLVKLRISDCQSLKGIPDLSGLASLDQLHLWGNRSMEEVGELSSSLRDVEIGECGALERVPDISRLNRLEKLQISNCQSLKGIPDLSSLARLDQLILSGNRWMEEVGGLSSSLRDVQIGGCNTLKEVPDISGLTRLERLALYKNEALEVVEGQSVSSTLTELNVIACPRLRRFPERFKMLCMYLSRAE